MTLIKTHTLALACAMALTGSLAAITPAHAVPGFEVILTDQANAANNSTTFFSGNAASPAPFTFGAYTLALNLSTNFPGTGILGSLSTQVTMTNSGNGPQNPFTLDVFVADSATPSTRATFTSPVGNIFSLVSNPSSTTNASLSAGTVVGKSISNALTLTSSPFAFGGAGGTQIGLFNGTGGYTLEDQLVFTGIVANGGLSNVTASISTSAILPEPVSMTIFGLGMAALGLARRRKN